MTLMATILTALCLSPARAMPPSRLRLRSPQVTVNSTNLQLLLLSRNEGLTVSRDQVDAELLRGDSLQNSLGLVLQVQLFRTDGASSGIYDGHAAIPTLMQVFPDSAKVGWFAILVFRMNPTRVTVSLYDESSTPLNTTTYPGGDRDGIGLYLSGPGGTFYSQDSRNPGTSPQVLCFLGTGGYGSGWWVAAEGQSLDGGSDADYDDVVWFLWGGFHEDVEGYGITPVHRTSWGQVKARFR